MYNHSKTVGIPFQDTRNLKRTVCNDTSCCAMCGLKMYDGILRPDKSTCKKKCGSCKWTDPGGCEFNGGGGGKCSSFSGCPHDEGQVTLDGGECVCGTGRQSFGKNLAKCCANSSGGKDLCHQFDCPRGGGNGGGGNGGGGSGNGGEPHPVPHSPVPPPTPPPPIPPPHHHPHPSPGPGPKSSGLSDGAIAGIAVGSSAVVIGLLVAFLK